ncbi:SNARE-like domain protein [[Clostridium] methylpentosum DSM 5476]|uniref:TVP38/TMEM64 family membrane protein n=1 Tax=[Clostridium] methylpentosum DSM 5476 TaxID=537013 RepID=C0E9K5_9FIRM|nr:SNARE-like domain protein [[Clostridium] methylpentosum DSM 5476]MEE1492107.1 TVP38/TMEM64 family protein [Massilioclostridium sp.]
MKLNREKMTKGATRLFQIVPIVLLVAVIILCSSLVGRVSVADILNFAPSSYPLAALALVGIYAVKSMSVFFPLLVLYVSAGTLFSPWWAILVNLVGLFVCVSIPYWLGRLSGRGLTEKLFKKYKKAEEIKRFNLENQWFICYILRVINLLPGDIVSLLLGSMGIGYKNYLLGSLAGLLPTMLAATFLGSTILTPTSPGFLCSAAATVVISVLSILLYRRMQKKWKNHETSSK